MSHQQDDQNNKFNRGWNVVTSEVHVRSGQVKTVHT